MIGPNVPRFAYSAIDSTGAPVDGVSKADTIADARATLLSQGLFPTKLAERRGLLQFEITKEKAKKKDLMHFTRQLAVFVRAGIPITSALETIGDETADTALRRAITTMVEELRNGGLSRRRPQSTHRCFPTTTWAFSKAPNSPDVSMRRSTVWPPI